MAELTQAAGGGNLDYRFGVDELGWDALHVVRFYSIEEISRPFEYDLTLTRAAGVGPLDLDAVLDAAATLAIRTGERFRLVHGIVAEAEEIDRTKSALMYRVLLVPHHWRARFRRRCRNFVDKSLAEIVSTALQAGTADHRHGAGGLTPAKDALSPVSVPNLDAYHPPRACYRWAVGNRSRIDDPAIRDYVVQYNESDFDFVSRLLEEEGISYHFEHDDTQSVMTLTDRPGYVPAAPDEARHELRSLASGLGTAGKANTEYVRTFGEARRMRSRSVKVRDFSFKRTRSPLEYTALSTSPPTSGGPAPTKAPEEASRHFEFPGGDENVTKDPCAHPARVRLERFEAERHLANGSGTVRTMAPCRRFTLHDPDGLREDGEYVVVRVTTTARQNLFGDASSVSLPEEPMHQTDFTALPFPKVFVPEDVTPKPLIFGVQSAIVTAEGPIPHQPEIEADPLGSVRVRFPWDEEPETGAPSSPWIRVSQMWAGSGFGGLHTPRVGNEVLVAYLQGNPDRPVIVGRVYNAQSPPPYNPQQQPTVSAVKSKSSPHSDGFNELRFEDLRGHEEVFLRAQQNLTETVLGAHATSVGGDQANIVGGNQSNKVVHDRRHEVEGDEENLVKKNRTTTVTEDETLSVEGKRKTTITGSDSLVAGPVDVLATDMKINLAMGFQLTTPFGSVGFDKNGCTIRAGNAELRLKDGIVRLTNGHITDLQLIGGIASLYGNSHAEVVGSEEGKVFGGESSVVKSPLGPVTISGTSIALNKL